MFWQHERAFFCWLVILIAFFIWIWWAWASFVRVWVWSTLLFHFFSELFLHRNVLSFVKSDVLGFEPPTDHLHEVRVLYWNAWKEFFQPLNFNRFIFLMHQFRRSRVHCSRWWMRNGIFVLSNWLLRLFARFAKYQPYGFVLSFELWFHFFKLLIWFKLVLLSVIVVFMGLFSDSKYDLIVFWSLMGSRRDYTARNKISWLLLWTLLVILWLKDWMISIKSMTKLLSMPEALWLQKLKFIVTAISELWQDIEFII